MTAPQGREKSRRGHEHSPEMFGDFSVLFLRSVVNALPLRYNSNAMPRSAPFRLVLVTCSSLPEARKIARSVVGKHLAACVNIHSSPVESIYTWEGRLETAREHLLIIKTTSRRLKSLEREVLRLHSYETPEFLVLPISGGSRAYLSWLTQSVRR
jgi:periplasmic divalent cation tolerance protein